MQKIIAIVGKTLTGKDAIANYISEKYGLPIVCSATTREKRAHETDGLEHKFVSKEEMIELCKSTLIAYTKNEMTGYEYCATAESVGNADCIYIVNPKGINWFKRREYKDIKMVTIYVDLPEKEIRKRATKRGDDPKVFAERLFSERDEFDTYKDVKGYDFIVSTDQSEAEVHKKIDECMALLQLEM